MAVNKTTDEFGNPTEGSTPDASSPDFNGQTQKPQPPQGGFDRNKYRDAWMENGAQYGGDVGRFNADHPDISAGVTPISGSNSGGWRLPTGEAMDLVIDKGGQNGAGWTGLGDMSSPTASVTPYVEGFGAASGGTGMGAAGAAGGASASGSTTGISAQDQAMRNKLFDTLMSRANQSLTVDSQTDPVIASQANAYNDSNTRQMRQYLSNLAEQQGPYANLGAETRSINESTGRDSGAFRSQLVGREVDARRAEIKDALDSMQGMLSTDQQASLSRELALLNDATQRYGISSSAQTAANSLDSNNSQFAQRFGLDTLHENNYWDALNKGKITG